MIRIIGAVLFTILVTSWSISGLGVAQGIGAGLIVAGLVYATRDEWTSW